MRLTANSFLRRVSSHPHSFKYSALWTRYKSSFPRIDPLVTEVLADIIHEPSKTAKQPSKSDLILPTTTDLPPETEWRKYFPNSLSTSHRVSIRNRESALAIANAFVPSGSRDKIVIEAYPGPGQLSRALLSLPHERIKKLIILEDNETYLQHLRPLEADPRVTVIPEPSFVWQTYQNMQANGVLDDVFTQPWEAGVHPQLQFISHLPSTVIGEQLLAQLFRTIPDRQWLFKYGRVPLGFILSEYVWKRVTASIKEPTARCKLSVIAEAVAECSPAVPFSSLQPFDSHFHPSRPPITEVGDRKVNSRRVGNPFVAVNVIPKEQQLIRKGLLDKWDFCVRRLFVRKATPLKQGLMSLAPGAQSLLKKIADPTLPPDQRIDPGTPARELTVQDWAILIKAFDEWPFAPEDLSISEIFSRKDIRI